MSSKKTQTDLKSSKKIAEEEPKSTKNVTTQTTLEAKPKPAQPAAQLIQKILDCQFEIFGIVQGVSFRMYTMRRAEKLGVRGWCMNTPRNTFTGQIQGYEPAFEAMYAEKAANYIQFCYLANVPSLCHKKCFGSSTDTLAGKCAWRRLRKLISYFVCHGSGSFFTKVSSLISYGHKRRCTWNYRCIEISLYKNRPDNVAKLKFEKIPPGYHSLF
ncbi:uncharacterized protein LOC108155967 isoform X1 [Drosophila miranda]|uniref:uncharacterized protein LOC108155967 isoform X1 n=1 Tax=Drosophila miranda TaxID=7229 RepID=UPI00143F83DE|nr:uncharacterized protein LOC108155967 isoform X1 [Drosophila miranda]XP_033244514.1 uncharacterized protein LOC108155967 isoform X1 [Drosophila miranda]